MSHISLDYISASSLTKALSRCDTLPELREALESLIETDLAQAKGYINKYDNKWDKLEGTHLDELKQELEQIGKILNLLSKG